MKWIVKPATTNYQEYINKGAKAFLLALENFSSDYAKTVTLEEIANIKRDYPDIEIFVSLNKMFFDDEIISLTEVLKKLECLQVAAVLFYDLAILELKQELNLQLELVWNQTHMVTNYNTCAYYHNQGVKYAFLSNEITLEEMLEIKRESPMKCIVMVMGYPVVAHSKRSLLTNYFHAKKKPVTPHLIIEEPVSHQKYQVLENATGTVFFYHQLLNGSPVVEALLEASFEYALLNEEQIAHPLFLEVLEKFDNLRTSYQEQESEDTVNLLAQIEKLIGNYQGFFNRKTIYKVKKNEED